MCSVFIEVKDTEHPTHLKVPDVKRVLCEQRMFQQFRTLSSSVRIYMETTLKEIMQSYLF